MAEKSAIDLYEDMNISIGDVIRGYEVLEKIDEGNFGQVFKVGKNGKKFAMKAEPNRTDGGRGSLNVEMDVFVDLQAQNAKYFPRMIMGGKEHKFFMIVMELLGENLKKLRLKCKDPTTTTSGTWSRVGIQCLYVLKQMHDCGFVHRDIKPGNFSMGPAEDGLSCRILYLLDFGISRKFVRNQKTEFRLARKTNKSFKGTPVYASPNAHALIELGRIDDVWSLMYMIAELVKPLPWESMEGPALEKTKLSCKLKDLFKHDKFDEVETMLRDGNYYTFPNYDLVFRALKSVYNKSCVSWIDPYDWETPQLPSYQRWKDAANQRLKLFPWEYNDAFGQFLLNDPFKPLQKAEFGGKTMMGTVSDEKKPKKGKPKKKKDDVATAEVFTCDEQNTPLEIRKSMRRGKSRMKAMPK